MNELNGGGKVVGGTDRRRLTQSDCSHSLLFYEIGRGRMTAMHGQDWLHWMKYWFGWEQSRVSGVRYLGAHRTALVSWGKMRPSYQRSQLAAFTSALYRRISAFCQIATLILWLNHPLCASPHLR